MRVPKTLMRKKSKEDEETFSELTHHSSQAKCQLVQTSHTERIELFLIARLKL